MMPSTCRALAALSITLALAPCQGLFVPDRTGPTGPAVRTGLLAVDVAVQDGAATTELRQTIHNDTSAPQEAYWFLPLPHGATADRFSMTVGGVETQGEVLDAGRAREIYEDIVRRRRDPGLLEYLGEGLLRARVFPIPPHGEVQVRVRWTRLLDATDGLTSLRFPLRSAWQDGGGPQKVGLTVTVRSKLAIRTAWSPLHGLEITRPDDHTLRAGFEYAGGTAPPRDPVLHWGVAEQDFGANVLTFRQPGEPGHFLCLLAPRRDWPQREDMARSINLVLDTSGSMAGEKIQQARAAVRTFLQSLSPTDWFNVVPFSTDARPFFDEPVRADAENVADALARVDGLEARGGTNIGDALLAALRRATPDCCKPKDGPPPQIVPITVFLTDGLPTVGATGIDALLELAREHNTNRARMFVFGVGHDVNTRLLDTLAQDSRGDRDYVQPGEDIEHRTAALFAKLSGPVMTDVQLRIDGLQLTALEPRELPDLFVRGQIAVVGRYTGEGHRALRLRGTVGGRPVEYVFEADFPARNAQHDWLPTLWAQRRVAGLLDAIRLHGDAPELVAEVVRLGREHGIVTPYTSHLVVEEGVAVARARGVAPGAGAEVDRETAERLRREWARSGAPAPDPTADPQALRDLGERAAAEAERAADGMTAGDEVGAAAVAKSAATRLLAAGGLHDPDGAVALVHRRVAGRSFHLVGGVWVDAAFTAGMQGRVRVVEAFSDAWFALVRERPHLAPVLAFSTRIVVVDGEDMIEVR